MATHCLIELKLITYYYTAWNQYERIKQFPTTIVEELIVEGRIVFLPHIQIHKPSELMTCYCISYLTITVFSGPFKVCQLITYINHDINH